MGRRVVDAPRRDAYGRVRVHRARRTRPVARVCDARRGMNLGCSGWPRQRHGRAQSWDGSAAAPAGNMRTGQMQLHEMERTARDSPGEMRGDVCVDGVVGRFAAHVTQGDRSRAVLRMTEGRLG